MKRAIVLVTVMLALAFSSTAGAAPPSFPDDTGGGFPPRCHVYSWHFWYPGSPGGWWCYNANYTAITYMGW